MHESLWDMTDKKLLVHAFLQGLEMESEVQGSGLETINQHCCKGMQLSQSDC